MVRSLPRWQPRGSRRSPGRLFRREPGRGRCRRGAGAAGGPHGAPRDPAPARRGAAAESCHQPPERTARDRLRVPHSVPRTEKNRRFRFSKASLFQYVPFLSIFNIVQGTPRPGQRRFQMFVLFLVPPVGFPNFLGLWCRTGLLGGTRTRTGTRAAPGPPNAAQRGRCRRAWPRPPRLGRGLARSFGRPTPTRARRPARPRRSARLPAGAWCLPRGRPPETAAQPPASACGALVSLRDRLLGITPPPTARKMEKAPPENVKPGARGAHFGTRNA